MIKVLIVDDEKLVRKGIISIMPWEKYGMTVVGEAYDGKSALEFMNHDEVHLLVTDLSMPGESGIEFIGKVRRLYPELWIVILTFHQDFTIVQEALRLGVMDYIAKAQIEIEQGDQILNRIQERIRSETEKNGSGNDVTQTSEIDMSRIQEFISGFKHWAWVKNDASYEELISRLHSLKPPNETIWSIFLAIYMDWKMYLKADTLSYMEETKGFSQWHQFKDWLDSFRNKLRTTLHSEKYSAEIMISIKKAIRYMEEHLAEKIALQEILTEVNMSKSYFSECFKDITGKSFHEYLQDLRVKKSKMLLESTDKPTQWIAENSGFFNENYFRKVFKKCTDLQPKAYRDQVRAGADGDRMLK